MKTLNASFDLSALQSVAMDSPFVAYAVVVFAVGVFAYFAADWI